MTDNPKPAKAAKPARGTRVPAEPRLSGPDPPEVVQALERAEALLREARAAGARETSPPSPPMAERAGDAAAVSGTRTPTAAESAASASIGSASPLPRREHPAPELKADGDPRYDWEAVAPVQDRSRRRFNQRFVLSTLSAVALIALGVLIIGPAELAEFIQRDVGQFRFVIGGVLIGAGIQVVLRAPAMVNDGMGPQGSMADGDQ